MTETNTAQRHVGELVAERASRSRVFERFGIDYCCGGKWPLQDACAKQGLDLAAVVRELDASDRNDDSPAPQQDWSKASLASLCDHIVAQHHAYLRLELPRLSALIEKVAGVHGSIHPELLKIRSIFKALKEEMELHMMKEEQVLFPMCKQLERATVLPDMHCGTVNNPIHVMEYEHEHAGQALQQMRLLTGGYRPPLDACNSYRAMLDALDQLEKDMHQHVHKENNILFPRASAIEARLARKETPARC